MLVIGVTSCLPGGVERNPNEPPPPLFDLTGTWGYSAQFFGAEGFCDVTGLTFTLRQSGNDLTGTTRGGVAECSVRDQFRREPLPDMVIRDGRIFADRMIMSFGEGQAWRHAGSVLGELIQGTAEMTRDFGGQIGVATFSNGNWTATRLR